jgi:hypothetical protein
MGRVGEWQSGVSRGKFLLVQCPNAQCQMSNAQCPMPNDARCFSDAETLACGNANGEREQVGRAAQRTGSPMPNAQ